MADSADGSKAVDPNQPDVKKRLDLHVGKTSCMTWNEEMEKYDPVPITAGPAKVGHAARSVGVQLYFQLLKEIGFVFLVMFLLSMPMIIFNVSGSMMLVTSARNEQLAKTSLANIGNCPSTGCQTAEDYEERCVFDGDCNLSSGDKKGLKVKDVAQWIGLLDGVAILFLVFFCLYFKEIRIPRVRRAFNDMTIMPSDFSICLSVLPRKLGEGTQSQEHQDYAERLKSHLESVLKSSKEKPLGEEEAKNAVSKVTLVREYNGQVYDYMEKGKLLRALANAQAVKETGKEADASKHQKRIDKQKAAIEKIDKKFESEKGVKDTDREVCLAYVILNKVEYAENLLSEYRFARLGFLFRILQSSRLRFDGHRICARPAENPSNLYWENLDFHPYKRLARSAVVWLLALVVLIICAVILYSIKRWDTPIHNHTYPIWVLENNQRTTAANECLRICNLDMFDSPSCSGGTSDTWGVSRFFYSQGDENMPTGTNMTVLSGTAVNCQPTRDSPTCAVAGSDVREDWIGVEFDAPREVKCLKLTQSAAGPLDQLRVYGCTRDAVPAPGNRSDWKPSSTCSRMMAVRPRQTLHSPNSTGVDSGFLQLKTDLSCADSSYQDSAAAAIFDQELRFAEQFMCHDLATTAKKVGLYLVGVFSVTNVNDILTILFGTFMAFSRHPTRSEFMRSQLGLTFAGQFINTALLTYLVNQRISNMPGILKIISEPLALGKGAFYGPDAIWFEAVGMALLITILIAIIRAVTNPICWVACVVPLWRRIAIWWSPPRTEDALKEAYTLSEWCLIGRLATSMNIFACVLVYSSGMPLLYLFALLYCAVAFWLDKYTLVRWSQRPPAYSEEPIVMCISLFPIAILCHSLFACLVMGDQDILPSNWSTLKGLGERLFGISEQEYTSVLETWNTASSAERDAQIESYAQARLLDFARQGCWLSMLTFLGTLAYYILYFLVKFLIQPIAPCVTTTIRTLFQMKCGWCMPRVSKDDREKTYEECVTTTFSKVDLPVDYEMESNKRYKAAADAILHTLKKEHLSV